MQALVLGAGKAGVGIAQHLVDQNAKVIVVDRSPQVVNYVKHFTSIPIVPGDAFDLKFLKSICRDEPSHIIATMSHDEQNIVACKVIGHEFSAATKIARVRSRILMHDEISKLFLKSSFSIDAIIQPEAEVAKSIASIIPIKNASDVVYMSNIVIVSLKCLEKTEVLNTGMNQFESITDFMFHILTISRSGKVFFPSKNDVLLPGDDVYIATGKEYLSDVLRIFGYSQEYKQNILIVGGGNIGETLVQMLLEQYSNITVNLVEKSKERANELAQKFPKLIVMFGDAQNAKFLQDSAANIDTALVATNDEKTNILTSLFLKNFAVPRVFALSSNKNYEQLLSAFSGANVINPNTIIVDNIVKQSRDINGLETITLLNQFACIVEATVSEACSYIGAGLNLLTMKNQMKPIFVIREGKITKAKKDYKIAANDVIVLLVVKEQFEKIEKFFSGNFAREKGSNNVTSLLNKIKNR